MVRLKPIALRDNLRRGCFLTVRLCMCPNCRIQYWPVSEFWYTEDSYLLHVNIVNKDIFNVAVWRKYIVDALNESNIWRCCLEANMFLAVWENIFIDAVWRKICLMFEAELFRQNIWATEMKKTSLRSCIEANMFKAALLYIDFCFKCMLV